MARKPTSKPTGTEIVDWEQEMANQAKIAASQQRATGGSSKSFSLRAGQLSYDGAPCVGNRIVALVVADVLMNKYFTGPFVEGEAKAPVCFAFGKAEADMEPHTAVDNDAYFERQHSQCAGCPQNEWGSAEVGRGKACKNSQRLGLVIAGTYSEKGSGRNKSLEFEGLIDDAEHYETAELATLELPVTSTKNFANYVRQLSADLNRPPHGVFTEIWVEPDTKTQFKVMFEVVDKVPNALLPTVMARHAKEQTTIDAPYSPPNVEEAAAPMNNKLRGKRK